MIGVLLIFCIVLPATQPTTMAAQPPEGFHCTSCGKWHEGLPLDLAFPEPVYVEQIPPAERKKRVEGLGTDFRIVDGKDYFLRGVVEIPIRDSESVFIYGVWVSLSKKSFERANQIYHNDDACAAEPAFFGWFSNSMGDYPDTINLKTNIKLRPKCRGAITLEPTDHPLAVEQREGITWERVQKIVERALHPE